jgi:hypothetical protein
MKLRVLGCSGGIGGIGGRHLRTSSFLVDHDILIDAGTGVAELSVSELAGIDHVFLTHAHLDHIASLPLMIDTVADLREQAADRLWHPGGARQSAPAHLQLGDLARLHERAGRLGAVHALSADRSGQADPVLDGRHDHRACRSSIPCRPSPTSSIPASPVSSIPAIPGRATPSGRQLNRIGNLRHLIIECAFSNRGAATR